MYGERNLATAPTDPGTDNWLDVLEMRLGAGLRSDAQAVGRMEATARVLLALAPPEGLTMSEMASRIVRDPSTVTRFVHRAAAEGWVEQRPGTEDRRTRVVHLTEKGRALRARLVGLRDARAAALREGVSTRTGLGAEEVDWFLAAVLSALAPGVRCPPTA